MSSIKLEQTKNGKDCIILDHCKYREHRTYANRGISWQCLGHSCNAYLRTGPNKHVLKQSCNQNHKGNHPVTIRNLGLSSPKSKQRLKSPSYDKVSKVSSLNTHSVEP